MSDPTKLGVEALERLGRYLVKRRRLVFLYPWQEEVECLEVYMRIQITPAASAQGSRIGQLRDAGSARAQGVVIDSAHDHPIVGEAELHGVVRASAAGLGMLALLADFGARLPMVWTDSTASIGICKRQGLGKVRHLAVQDLWVQQRVRGGDFELFKIPGERNPADLFTKFGLPPERVEMLLRLLGCNFADGRPASPAWKWKVV